MAVGANGDRFMAKLTDLRRQGASDQTLVVGDHDSRHEN